MKILGQTDKLGDYECKGKVVDASNGRKKRGRHRQRGYGDIFNCRWEVIAPPGKQIKVNYDLIDCMNYT